MCRGCVAQWSSTVFQRKRSQVRILPASTKQTKPTKQAAACEDTMLKAFRRGYSRIA